MISPRRLVRSFGNALRGVFLVFKSEQSFRLQVLAAAAVCALGWYVHVSPLEWVVLIVLISAVLSLELINSVLERFADAFKPRLHPAVRDIKDMMAGVVLVASLAAAVVGLFIFLPRLALLF